MSEGLMILIMYGVVSCGVSVSAVTDLGVDDMYFTPKSLYKKTKMNIFGCTVCSAALIAISPIYSGIVIVIWSIYKLFHVGRKIEDK